MLALMIWGAVYWLAYVSAKGLYTGFKDTPEANAERARPLNPQPWQIQAWERRWQRQWHSKVDNSGYTIAALACLMLAIGGLSETFGWKGVAFLALILLYGVTSWER